MCSPTTGIWEITGIDKGVLVYEWEISTALYPWSHARDESADLSYEDCVGIIRQVYTGFGLTTRPLIYPYAEDGWIGTCCGVHRGRLEISFAPKFRNIATVLHECAHALLWEIGHDWGHTPEFLEIEKYLVVLFGLRREFELDIVQL